MTISLDQLQALMDANENEHIEFKEAKNNFHFEKLVKYCAALANEGGGSIVLGVTDKPPRRVVGSNAFADIERTKAGLVERLRLRIEIDLIPHPDGRVLVILVPSRPLGVPVQFEGAYWMRGGEDLVPMTPDMLKRIFEEAVPDFSAEVCEGATVDDLDKDGIEFFRDLWIRKSENPRLRDLTSEQLLADAELSRESGLTYAALILFGTRQSLGRWLAQAEVIFEYRSSESSVRYQQREEFRQGFFLFSEQLWNLINLRNDKQHFQDGLFVWDIPTFNETVVRESILNAVSHRDYRRAGSVFVKQFPHRLEIISPGGLPTGVTPENILYRQEPRNRRIAETLAKCGLVERAGQGFDLIFRECIRESKSKPDFAHTDAFQVAIALEGEIQDARFLRFLEEVHQKRLGSFTVDDYLLLDCVHWDRAIPLALKSRIPTLIEKGVIEAAGRGRYILSRSLYAMLGKKGVYTRKRGLDRATNKQLLLKHIVDNSADGSRLNELMQVLPALTRSQVQMLLRELQSEAVVHVRGTTRAALWFAGSAP